MRRSWSYLVAALLLAGCDFDWGLNPEPVGDLIIESVTTGSSLDPDGYVVRVNCPHFGCDEGDQRLSSREAPIGVNARVEFFGLSSDANWQLVLEDVANSCSVVGWFLTGAEGVWVPENETGQADVEIKGGKTTRYVMEIVCL